MVEAEAVVVVWYDTRLNNGVDRSGKISFINELVDKT
jgi:hypothetical protein